MGKGNKSRKYGSASSSGYYDDDYYGKPKYQPLMTDDNVADIKPESMFGHLIYALNRFVSGYIYPYIQLVWEYTFSPIFNIVFQGFSYFNDFLWQSIYINTIEPILLKIQENISYIAQWIIDIFKRIYTEYIGPIMKWIIDVMYDYIYSPICKFFKMIWKNMIKLFLYIGKGIKWLCIKIKDGIIYAADFIRDIVFKFIEKVYQQILYVVIWTVNKISDYVLIPFKELCVKIWRDYLYHIIVSIHDGVKDCGKAIYHSMIDLWNDYIYGIIHGSLELAKKFCKAISDTISKLWNDYIYDIIVVIGDFVKKCWKSIYETILNFCDCICDGIAYTADKVCDAILKGIEWSINKIYQYLLKPLCRFIAQIWTNYVYENMRPGMIYIGDKCSDIMQWINQKVIIPLKQWIVKVAKQTTDYIYDVFYFIFSKIFKAIWTMICYCYHSVVWILEFTKRYLLEINVGKLNIQKINEHLNNFEIGVYYGKVKGSTVYLKRETTGNDANIYLWLRNNNELKHANAKVVIYKNDTQIHKKMVRLNKKMSHSIPFNKTIFEDNDGNCRRIRIEFMLEDISKTKQDQDNRQSIIVNNQNRNMAQRNLNNNQDNTSDDEDDDDDDEFNNVALGGNGATYIAVEKSTKCYHEFSLCYK